MIISREAPNRRTFIDYYVRSSDQKWVASRPDGDIVRTSYENMRKEAIASLEKLNELFE